MLALNLFYLDMRKCMYVSVPMVVHMQCDCLSGQKAERVLCALCFRLRIMIIYLPLFACTSCFLLSRSSRRCTKRLLCEGRGGNPMGKDWSWLQRESDEPWQSQYFVLHTPFSFLDISMEDLMHDLVSSFALLGLTQNVKIFVLLWDQKFPNGSLNASGMCAEKSRKCKEKTFKVNIRPGMHRPGRPGKVASMCPKCAFPREKGNDAFAITTASYQQLRVWVREKHKNVG